MTKKINADKQAEEGVEVPEFITKDLPDKVTEMLNKLDSEISEIQQEYAKRVQVLIQRKTEIVMTAAALLEIEVPVTLTENYSLKYKL